MYTTSEAAALLNTARLNVQKWCLRHDVPKRGRDYDIDGVTLDAIRRSLGKRGRWNRERDKETECNVK